MYPADNKQPLQRLLTPINMLVSGRFWLWKSLFVIVACSIFFQFPNYKYFSQQNAQYETHVPAVSKGNNFWAVLVMQRDNLLVQNTFHECPRHEDVMAYRLALPLIAKVFHLNPFGMFVVLHLCNILFLGLLLYVVHKHTQDKKLAFFLALATSCIYIGCSGFIDAIGLVVIIGYAFIMMSISFRNPLIIILSVLIAVWSDERALLGSTLAFYWWLGIDSGFRFKGIKDIKFFNIRSMSVVAAWGIYFIGRAILTYGYGFNMDLGYQGFYILFDVYDRLGLSIWSTFEGLWILVILLIAMVFVVKDWINGLFILGGFVLLFAGGTVNHDTTKSYSFAFLLVPIAIIYLKNLITLADIKKLVAASALVCMLSPTVYIINTIMYTSPIYQEGLLFIKARYYNQLYTKDILDTCYGDHR